MAIPASGAVSLSQVNQEYLRTGTTQISLNDQLTRAVCGGDVTGPVSLGGARGYRVQTNSDMIAGTNGSSTGYAFGSFGSFPGNQFQLANGALVLNLSTLNVGSTLTFHINQNLINTYLKELVFVGVNNIINRFQAPLASSFTNSLGAQWTWTTSTKFIASSSYKVYVITT